mgnify:CR=1 FL=1|jgi:elongation factor Ts
MAITAQQVKALRQKTGAGIMDCKEALSKTEGDVEKAEAWLREQGLKTYDKKANRAASEGLVTSYIHPGGKIGVLVEVNCETDFVARTDTFQDFVKEIAMQVAAMNPTYVSRDDVPDDAIEKERAILQAQAEKEGKPPEIAAKIVTGRLRKFYEERCLMDMAYIKEESKTVETLLKEIVAAIGERVEVRRFARYTLGQESTTAESVVETDEDGDE